MAPKDSTTLDGEGQQLLDLSESQRRFLQFHEEQIIEQERRKLEVRAAADMPRGCASPCLCVSFTCVCAPSVHMRISVFATTICCTLVKDIVMMCEHMRSGVCVFVCVGMCVCV
jgi:hypothetical protein